jgi:hypothetical protein
MKWEYNKHTYEAYKTMIKVEIKLSQLWFMVSQIKKQKLLQKI